jgi:hypothetical protein
MSSSLPKYHQAALQYVAELQHAFSLREQEYISFLLAQMGQEGWDDWLHEHWEEIDRYLSKSPSERKRRKAWQQEQLQPLMAFAALQQARENLSIFEGLLAAQLRVATADESTRGLVAYSRFFYLEVDSALKYALQPWWPFHPDVPSPFVYKP